MGDFDCCTGRGDECSSVPTPDRPVPTWQVGEKVYPIMFENDRRAASNLLMMPMITEPSPITETMRELQRRLTEQDIELRASLPPSPPGYRWHTDLRITGDTIGDAGRDEVTLRIVYQLRPVEGAFDDY